MNVSLVCNLTGQNCANTGSIEKYAGKIDAIEARYDALDFVEVTTVGIIACEGCSFRGNCGAKLEESTARVKIGDSVTTDWPIRTEGKRPEILGNDIIGLVDGFTRTTADTTSATRTGKLVNLFSAIVELPSRAMLTEAEI